MESGVITCDSEKELGAEELGSEEFDSEELAVDAAGMGGAGVDTTGTETGAAGEYTALDEEIAATQEKLKDKAAPKTVSLALF